MHKYSNMDWIRIQTWIQTWIRNSTNSKLDPDPE